MAVPLDYGHGESRFVESRAVTEKLQSTVTVVLTDTRGYGCLNRLQIGCGVEEFNNMDKDCNIEGASRRSTSSPMLRQWGPHREGGQHSRLEAQIVAARGRDRHIWESQPDSDNQ